ncbi:MAG: FAD-binding oxidoreductase [Pirellulales bacterium]|nr:FAD-binding oxidoreductase [Pirellulales bacterium]
MSIPARAEIVIVGGGAVGCGAAYALANAGQTDVVVIERAAGLAQATTSQGAGLCGQIRASVERTQLAMHSAAVFRRLQAESPVRPDWHPVGSLRIGLSSLAARHFARLKQIADQAGVEAELIDPAAAQRICPVFDFSSATSILWCPSDGYMTPQCVAAAYAHQAQQHGVRFVVGTSVTGITLVGGRVAAVETNAGRIECGLCINAAGANAYHVARLVGLELPIVPVRHEYFVSLTAQGMHAGLPCFRIPETALYGRAAGDALLLGGWERASLAHDPRQYALAGAPPEVVPDEPLLDDFARRLAPLYPAATGLARQRIGRGWPTFTPDGAFLIGPTRHVPGFVMAGGCNAHGISGSGGIGRLLVESLLATEPSEYVRSLSPDRFLDRPWDWDTAQSAAQAVYETYYDIEGC